MGKPAPVESRVDIRREDGKRWMPAPFTLPIALPIDRVPSGVVLGAWLADDEVVEWVVEKRGGGEVTTGFKINKKQ